MPKRKTASERYYVDALTGCWNWLGPLSKAGYALGTVQRSQGGIVRQAVAHRMFYEEAKGPIPEGLVLDHLCRNRRCVNPDHLEPVTQVVNRRRSAKLNETDIAAIRLARQQGRQCGAIAQQFNVSPSYVSRISRNERWSN